MTEDANKYYDAVAAGYAQQYQRENLYTSEEYPANYFRLQILIRQLATAGAKSVYEVGLGEGTPLIHMAKMGFNVAGCDIAEAMVKAARMNFEKNGLSPDVVHWGDIEDATTFAGQLKGGQFDAVIAAGVMPHVRKDELTLRNIGMIVKPGGKVLIEFRNKLFSLFTLNRYTKEFFLDDLLAGVDSRIRSRVEKELDARLAVNVPPKQTKIEGSDAPGYDAILSKFHNPFELLETFKKCGFQNPKLHWYHFHPAPPMLEKDTGSTFREAAIALEHTSDWRGMFLCSAGVVEADRAP